MQFNAKYLLVQEMPGGHIQLKLSDESTASHLTLSLNFEPSAQRQAQFLSPAVNLTISEFTLELRREKFVLISKEARITALLVCSDKKYGELEYYLKNYFAVHPQFSIKEILDLGADPEEILFCVVRYIEDANGLTGEENYWDCNLGKREDRIFYCVWHWLQYMELEADCLLKPPPEFKEVFGVQREKRILSLIENEGSEAEKELLSLSLSGAVGQILLEWATENIR